MRRQLSKLAPTPMILLFVGLIVDEYLNNIFKMWPFNAMKPLASVLALQMAASFAVGFTSFWRNLRHFQTRQNAKTWFSSSNHSCSNWRHVRWVSRVEPPQTEEMIPSSTESVDPFAVAKPYLAMVMQEIRKMSEVNQPELKKLSNYYFDGNGKLIRPTIVTLMAKALNMTVNKKASNNPLPGQLQIAAVAELIHTATLVHDDVIDLSNIRRGKASINTIWGQRKAILGGDFVLSSAAEIVARLKNHQVTSIFAGILSDLVQGELMQLGSKERDNDRFNHYLLKNFKKTASLMANSCKAVAVLANADDKRQHLAFEYGRNVGVAFQLIDDVLDFESPSSVLGKPATADLKLGLATAPVLFACEEFPELNSMIMRRFSHPGDVEIALKAVINSKGIIETRRLAERHCVEALKWANQLSDCIEQRALCVVPEIVLHRVK